MVASVLFISPLGWIIEQNEREALAPIIIANVGRLEVSATLAFNRAGEDGEGVSRVLLLESLEGVFRAARGHRDAIKVEEIAPLIHIVVGRAVGVLCGSIHSGSEGIAEALLVGITNVDTALLRHDPARRTEVGGAPDRRIPVEFQVELDDAVDAVA